MALATATSENRDSLKKINSDRDVHKACEELISYIGLKEVENKIGDTIPTFGGLFIDEEQSTIYVYVMNKEDDEKVKRIISAYGNDVNLKVLKGKYSFKQLMRWKNDLTKSLLENKRGLNVTLIDIGGYKEQIRNWCRGNGELKDRSNKTGNTEVKHTSGGS
jgi:ATP-dependent 26S proteasome regulatory subunit